MESDPADTDVVTAHRWRPPRLAASLLAALLAMLVWWVPSAVADTTVIGEQNLVPNAATIDQLGQNIPVFQGDAGGGYVLSSPRAGTITSWSFLSGGAATGSHFELAVLAPTDQTGTGWRLLALSSPVAVSSAMGTDAVNGPFPVSIPIDVGERIALVPVDDANVPIESGTQNVDGIRFFSAPFASLGSSQDVVSTADSGQVVPIQATVTFAGAPLAPANTTLPSISGTARQFETLTGDPGLWQNGVDSFTYSWLRCAPDGTGCVTVPQSNSTMYTLTRSDVGFAMRFQVIASNGGGDSQPSLSTPTAVVQPGVITAKLTVFPNPSCTGVPTALSASGSVSPDGIKSYSFRIVDLWAAIQQDAVDNPQFPIFDEGAAYLRVLQYVTAFSLPDGGTGELGDLFAPPHDVRYLTDHFAGPAIVTGAAQPTITETFTWNRAAIYTLGDPNVHSPNTLARDAVGVVLVVTDYAGHTAQAFAPLTFAQHLSSDSRAACRTPQLSPFLSSAVLQARVLFRGSQLSTTARCQTRVACIGTITVTARTRVSHAFDAAQRAPRVLATGFFNIPPHHNRQLSLKLTKLGKRLLHHGARLPVMVTVTSVSPTGRSRQHSYSELLTRR